MLFEGSQHLVDDHVALDELLKHLQSTLNHGQVDAIYAELDRFWAKLAVHIRAEHLHLFPTILHGLTEPAAVLLSVPTLAEARINIERLRADHDFLMRQLSNAVETIRSLINTRETTILDNGLSGVRATILDIEQRLAHHNQIEESGIYRWAGIVLDMTEQAELTKRMNRELENRPPRFAANVW